MTGCLLRLVLLPITIAALYFLINFHGSWPNVTDLATGDAAPPAVIAGILFWFAGISWLDLRFLKSDRSLINKSFARDGERIVVSGLLKSKAPLIKSPFSRRECVGYYYSVTHTSSRAGGSSTKWTDYEGYAIIPAVISSELGDLKILAQSNSELFHDVPAMTSDNMLDTASQYLKTVDFMEVFTGPGDFRVDKKIGNKPDLNKCKFEEKIIRKDERVLVAGVYSKENGGIAPDPDDIMKPFHIVPDGETVLNRKIRNRFLSIAIGTFLGTVVIMVYYFTQ